MASYPGSKVHRPSRRKLGRGQRNFAPGVVITPTFSSTTVSLTFSAPVVVSGTIPVSCSNNTFVSQTVVSATLVTQTFSSVFTTAMTVSLASNPNQVRTPQGGACAGFSIVG